MKRDYVNLKVQVIQVQLSDCIAGSGINQVSVDEGVSEITEMNNVSSFQTDIWSK